MTRLLLAALLVTSLGTVGGAATSGCTGWESDQPPIVPIRNMYNQPRWDTQEKKTFFSDQRSMRPEVPGVVSREMETDLTVATGRNENGSRWLMEVPGTVIERNGGAQAFIERGQDRYNIYCAPCHSDVGDGLGLVSRRATALGATKLVAKSLHAPHVLRLPDGQVYATISNGLNKMPAYDYQMPVDDRWAIVLYVRALQLSQLKDATAQNTEQAK